MVRRDFLSQPSLPKIGHNRTTMERYSFSILEFPARPRAATKERTKSLSQTWDFRSWQNQNPKMFQIVKTLERSIALAAQSDLEIFRRNLTARPRTKFVSRRFCVIVRAF
jgi:hypothetical protein